MKKYIVYFTLPLGIDPSSLLSVVNDMPPENLLIRDKEQYMVVKELCDDSLLDLVKSIIKGQKKSNTVREVYDSEGNHLNTLTISGFKKENSIKLETSHYYNYNNNSMLGSWERREIRIIYSLLDVSNKYNNNSYGYICADYDYSPYSPYGKDRYSNIELKRIEPNTNLL